MSLALFLSPSLPPPSFSFLPLSLSPSPSLSLSLSLPPTGEVYILASSKSMAQSHSGKLYKLVDPKRYRVPSTNGYFMLFELEPVLCAVLRLVIGRPPTSMSVISWSRPAA